MRPNGDFWVFAYGSLLWDLPFHPTETYHASLLGYHRRFCMDSVNLRGTPEAPGLVLGLVEDADAMVHGLVFKVPKGEEEEVHRQLTIRELSTSGYREIFPQVKLKEIDQSVPVLTYVISADNPYFRDLSLAEQANIIATAHGDRGANSDYLFATIERLKQLEIEDEELNTLANMVEALQRNNGSKA